MNKHQTIAIAIAALLAVPCTKAVFARETVDRSAAHKFHACVAKKSATRGNSKVDALCDSAWEKYDKDDYDGAIVDLTEAIKLDPKCIYAWNLRGLCKRYKKDHKGAILDFTEEVKLDPQSHNGYHNRGYSEFELGGEKDWEAMEDLNKAIRYEPRDGCSRTYSDIAYVYYTLNYNGTTIDHEDHYLKLEPDNSPADYAQRASCWEHYGIKDKALADYTKAAEQFAKQGDAEMEKRARAAIDKLNQG